MYHQCEQCNTKVTSRYINTALNLFLGIRTKNPSIIKPLLSVRPSDNQLYLWNRNTSKNFWLIVIVMHFLFSNND